MTQKSKRKRQPAADRRLKIIVVLICIVVTGGLLSAAQRSFHASIAAQEAQIQRLTQEYLMCSATHVYKMPDRDLSAALQRAFDASSIVNPQRFDAYFWNDWCAEPRRVTASHIWLRFAVPDAELTDEAALGLRVAQVLDLLNALDDAPQRPIDTLQIEFYANDAPQRPHIWQMDYADALASSTLDITTQALFSLGRTR